MMSKVKGPEGLEVSYAESRVHVYCGGLQDEIRVAIFDNLQPFVFLAMDVRKCTIRTNGRSAVTHYVHIL